MTNVQPITLDNGNTLEISADIETRAIKVWHGQQGFNSQPDIDGFYPGNENAEAICGATEEEAEAIMNYLDSQGW